MYGINVMLLRQKMLENGFINIVDLAKAANVSRDTISKMLAGKTKPQTNVMYAIANALKLTCEEAGKIFFARIVA
jgi:DNA-binding XRE family transcriptional regulator|nr:MAG TPA_asm: Helix-turn-helix XRE-family like protein [Caudoviricetes sp.]DAM68690.1 MAG TPA: Helix-turn-helix XRE-family like protein [Caudoviricetes sp.]DAY50802.1 MAG TPA: Helix-turn-helix XRE-family like protein [Caudoviricetes sp.]